MAPVVLQAVAHRGPAPHAKGKLRVGARASEPRMCGGTLPGSNRRIRAIAACFSRLKPVRPRLEPGPFQDRTTIELVVQTLDLRPGRMCDRDGAGTIEDALAIRQRVLLAFERAERQAYLTGQHGPLNFAIIGGGPTGIELAGAIAEIARRVLARDFKAIDATKARVMLFEGLPRVLSVYPEDISRKAEQQL